MKTELILIRHGETEWNQYGKFQGSTDIPLSEEGIHQAQLFKNSLKETFDYVYASPLIRAARTAEIICEGSKTPTPVIVPELREINFGAWEGLTLGQIKENYPKEFTAWRTDEKNGYLIGGDLSIKNASIRAKTILLSLAQKHHGSKIACVAHGGILKAGIIGIFDWKLTMYHHFFLGNTSITRITLDENNSPVLVTLNDTSHLIG